VTPKAHELNMYFPLGLFLLALSVKGSYENSRSDLTELGSKLCNASQVVFANDSSYVTAKLQHVEVFQYEPFVVIYATCEDDVVEFVNFVKSKEDIQFRIRSGGHSFGGYSNCDDCIILDLSQMNSVSMDPTTKAVTLGPGVDNAQLVREMTANDRMVPHGYCPTVCMGGFGQVGGTSILTRSLGLVVDYIESVNIVTADGTKRVCSYDESVEDQSLSENGGCSDLLWALRGSGGGQWGVITSYTLRTNELLTKQYTFGFTILFPATNASVRHLTQWMDTEIKNNTLDTACSFITGITNDGNTTAPEFLAIINGWWYGEDYEAGQQYVADKVLAEFTQFGAFLIPFLGMTYHELYSAMTAIFAEPPAQNVASRLIFDNGFDDAYVNALIEYLDGLQQDTSSYLYQGYTMTLVYELLNGATQNSELTKNTSFPNRDMLAYTQFALEPPALDSATLTQSNAYVAAFDSDILSLHSDQTYVGYKDAYQTEWQNHYFGRQPDLYAKLVAIKEKYDPENLFYDGVGFVPSSMDESDSAGNVCLSIYSLFLACMLVTFF